MYAVDAVATYIKALQIIYPTKEFRINLSGGQSPDNVQAKGGSAGRTLINKSLYFILVCTILINIQ